MRSKPFVSANFDNYSLPGGGDFDNFLLENVKIPILCPTPPPSGLTLIGAYQTIKNKPREHHVSHKFTSRSSRDMNVSL